MWTFFYHPIETYHLVKIHSSEEGERRQWHLLLLSGVGYFEMFQVASTPQGNLRSPMVQIRLRAMRRAVMYSAAMITVGFGGVERISGKIEASITLRPSTPRTAPSPSTTAEAS